jgi:hypothetical protein
VSLDVYLEDESGEEVYWANITHNLGRMATEADLYDVVWRPEEVGVETAGDLIGPLRAGILRMREGRERFEKFEASNGWGRYENFVPWLERYLRACEESPEARVRASR